MYRFAVTESGLPPCHDRHSLLRERARRYCVDRRLFLRVLLFEHVFPRAFRATKIWKKLFRVATEYEVTIVLEIASSARGFGEDDEMGDETAVVDSGFGVGDSDDTLVRSFERATCQRLWYKSRRLRLKRPADKRAAGKRPGQRRFIAGDAVAPARQTAVVQPLERFDYDSSDDFDTLRDTLLERHMFNSISATARMYITPNSKLLLSLKRMTAVIKTALTDHQVGNPGSEIVLLRSFPFRESKLRELLLDMRRIAEVIRRMVARNYLRLPFVVQSVANDIDQRVAAVDRMIIDMRTPSGLKLLDAESAVAFYQELSKTIDCLKNITYLCLTSAKDQTHMLLDTHSIAIEVNQTANTIGQMVRNWTQRHSQEPLPQQQSTSLTSVPLPSTLAQSSETFIPSSSNTILSRLESQWRGRPQPHRQPRARPIIVRRQIMQRDFVPTTPAANQSAVARRRAIGVQLMMARLGTTNCVGFPHTPGSPNSDENVDDTVADDEPGNPMRPSTPNAPPSSDRRHSVRAFSQAVAGPSTSATEPWSSDAGPPTTTAAIFAETPVPPNSIETSPVSQTCFSDLVQPLSYAPESFIATTSTATEIESPMDPVEPSLDDPYTLDLRFAVQRAMQRKNFSSSLQINHENRSQYPVADSTETSTVSTWSLTTPWPSTSTSSSSWPSTSSSSSSPPTIVITPPEDDGRINFDGDNDCNIGFEHNRLVKRTLRERLPVVQGLTRRQNRGRPKRLSSPSPPAARKRAVYHRNGTHSPSPSRVPSPYRDRSRQTSTPTATEVASTTPAVNSATPATDTATAATAITATATTVTAAQPDTPRRKSALLAALLWPPPDPADDTATATAIQSTDATRSELTFVPRRRVRTSRPRPEATSPPSRTTAAVASANASDNEAAASKSS